MNDTDNDLADDPADIVLRPPDSSAFARILPACGGTVDEIRLCPSSDVRGDEGAPHEEAVQILTGDSPVGVSSPSTGAGPNRCDTDWYCGRILAPWNDRIPGGAYRFAGAERRLTINDAGSGDAIHGFLYRLPMQVHDAALTTVTLCRTVTPADEPGYPHTLQIRVRYALSPSTFTLHINVENTGSGPAPLALGWHPYFRLPAAMVVDDLDLRLEASDFVPVNDQLVPTGKHEPLVDLNLDFRRPHALGHQWLDIAYRTPNRHTTHVSAGNLTLDICQSELFRYVQIFVPPDRRSLAVEPITAATNAFNMPQLGLRVLGPGENAQGSVSVTLRRTGKPPG